MWEKIYSILNPEYVTVSKNGQSLHFYLTGKDALETSEALVDLLNFKKKSKYLKLKDVVGEMAFLENGVKIGCAGTPSKILKGASEDFDNSERREYLRKIVKNF